MLPTITQQSTKFASIGYKQHQNWKLRELKEFGDFNLVLRQIQGDKKNRDVKLRVYHAYLELLSFDDITYKHLPRVQNQFVDVLTMLPSMVEILIAIVMHLLLIETMTTPSCYCSIGETNEVSKELNYDSYRFLRHGTYQTSTIAKDRKALRQLVVRFVIYSGVLCKRSVNGILLSRWIYYKVSYA